MNQPAPKVTEADVDRIVRRDFPPDEVAGVLAALAAYGKQKWHNEVARVRVAILKLAAGHRDKLPGIIRTADTDYRDVLSMAEYPAYFTGVSPSETDEAKQTPAINADWTQYRRWFERESPP